MNKTKHPGIVIVMPDERGDITLSLDEMQHVFNQLRNNVLAEVLTVVTAKLNLAGNISRELVLVDVLRAVNNMRTETFAGDEVDNDNF